MSPQLLELLTARKGHFKLESGHHGNLWLDLDRLFLQPSRVRPYALELAKRLSQYDLAAVCGPLIGGALIAQTIATELDVEFYYTERVKLQSDALYSVKYRLPKSLREKVRGKKFAIVDDVINAGSAVRGTMAELQANGAQAVVIGALLVLGNSAQNFCDSQKIPLEATTHLPNEVWIPATCPLCAKRIPLKDNVS